MDLSAILPLLLSKNNISSDKMDLISLLTKKDKSSEELLDAVMKNNGTPAKMASVISSINNSSNRAKENFTPILPFVNDEILGKMTRFFFS